MTASLPLRPRRRARSIVVRVVVALLALAAALPLTGLAGAFFNRPSELRPTVQHPVGAELLAAPADLPWGYTATEDSRDSYGLTAVSARLDDTSEVVVVYGVDKGSSAGERITLHRLDEDVEPTFKNFDSLPFGVVEDSRGALSTSPWPERNLAEDVSYQRLAAAAALMAAALWMFILSSTSLVAAVMVALGFSDMGAGVKALRASGVLLHPEAGPEQFYRACRSLGVWGALRQSWLVLGVLTAAVVLMVGWMEGLGTAFLVSWSMLPPLLAAAAVAAAVTLSARYGERLVRRVRCQLLLPTIPLLQPAWVLLTPLGARQRRRLRRTLDPSAYDTALNLAAEQETSLEELELLVEALEPI